MLHCTLVAAAGGASGSAGHHKHAASSAPVAGAAELPDWVVQHSEEAIKASKSPLVPFTRGTTDSSTNCWGDCDASIFHLRGHNYLTDSIKVPSAPAAFRIAGVNAFRSKKPITHAAAAITELTEYLAAHPTHQFFVVSWMLPGSPSHCVVHCFVRLAGHDPILDPLYQVPLPPPPPLCWLQAAFHRVCRAVCPAAVCGWRR